MSVDERSVEAVFKAAVEFEGSLGRVLDNIGSFARAAKEGLMSLGEVLEPLENFSKSSEQTISRVESMTVRTAALTREVEGMGKAWEEMERSSSLVNGAFDRADDYDDILGAQGRYHQAYLENEAAFLEAGLSLKRAAAADELDMESAKWEGFLENADRASGTFTDILDDLYTASGKKHRAMFEVMKAFSVAETVIQTYRAAQGAYAALAKIHPALGIAAAAAATASGMARVNSIRQTDPAGGGAVSGGSQGGGSFDLYPSPVDTESGGGQLTQNVTVQIYNPLSDENWQKIVEEDIIPALNAAADRNIEMKINIME